ncbi:pyridoxal-dependent decarboxylase, exosortase A system-associated [Altericroceibacterium endophyticum]|uniref:Pyridoxal-dependent decarboxylase, exosortase A system-associated n=1 Tax=Altericroceibacterium endophyticum TaxID=1808508 RepID=A0A6I4T7R6_9SPHN|nr:pyridoxal-dependent decarboxylase, exosortase A system-associated [Altericroceibacterium endophyticum]MXO66033.1 pyridoxal-dependent decarboxylase, exosortase A system-associated [Altericroceibacterium endophyticum]
MKPTGPIPEGFTARDHELVVGDEKVGALAARAGRTPVFLYSSARIEAQIAALRSAMPERLSIHYAVKANPFAPLLQFMAGRVDGFDVASAWELEAALAAGKPAQQISFAGPGKRDEELRLSVQHGATLNCESEGEAERTLAIAEELGCTPRMAIRVNPAFELRGSGMKMGGGPKPFGIDEDRVPALARHLIAAGADWQGLHIFTGSQALDADALIESQANVLALADRLAQDIGAPLPALNMGGGFGIPYFPGDTPLDIQAIGDALRARFAALPDSLANTRFAIELGRYLVGEAGVYLTRIIDRKESHGQIYLITDGGLHHQLAASGNFGAVVRRNYPSAIATHFGAEPAEEVNIVGCLCTPLDRLADQIAAPRADRGDLVAIFCAGAYGASASPAAFLGQGPAEEMLV